MVENSIVKKEIVIFFFKNSCGTELRTSIIYNVNGIFGMREWNAKAKKDRSMEYK